MTAMPPTVVPPPELADVPPGAFEWLANVADAANAHAAVAVSKVPAEDGWRVPGYDTTSRTVVLERPGGRTTWFASQVVAERERRAYVARARDAAAGSWSLEHDVPAPVLEWARWFVDPSTNGTTPPPVDLSNLARYGWCAYDIAVERPEAERGKVTLAPLGDDGVAGSGLVCFRAAIEAEWARRARLAAAAPDRGRVPIRDLPDGVVERWRQALTGLHPEAALPAGWATYTPLREEGWASVTYKTGPDHRYTSAECEAEIARRDAAADPLEAPFALADVSTVALAWCASFRPSLRDRVPCPRSSAVLITGWTCVGAADDLKIARFDGRTSAASKRTLALGDEALEAELERRGALTPAAAAPPAPLVTTGSLMAAAAEVRAALDREPPPASAPPTLADLPDELWHWVAWVARGGSGGARVSDGAPPLPGSAVAEYAWTWTRLRDGDVVRRVADGAALTLRRADVLAALTTRPSPYTPPAWFALADVPTPHLARAAWCALPEASRLVVPEPEAVQCGAWVTSSGSGRSAVARVGHADGQQVFDRAELLAELRRRASAGAAPGAPLTGPWDLDRPAIGGWWDANLAALAHAVWQGAPATGDPPTSAVGMWAEGAWIANGASTRVAYTRAEIAAECDRRGIDPRAPGQCYREFYRRPAATRPAAATTTTAAKETTDVRDLTDIRLLADGLLAEMAYVAGVGDPPARPFADGVRWAVRPDEDGSGDVRVLRFETEGGDVVVRETLCFTLEEILDERERRRPLYATLPAFTDALAHVPSAMLARVVSCHEAEATGGSILELPPIAGWDWCGVAPGVARITRLADRYAVTFHVDALRAELARRHGAAAPEVYHVPSFTLTASGETAMTIKKGADGEPYRAPSRLVQTLQTDATDAAWRAAGSQFVKLARDPLVALLSRHLGPDDPAIRARIAAFLDTEIGTALVTGALSAGLGAVPASVGNGVPARLARELRVRAMAETGDVLAEVLFGPLREVMATYLRDVQPEAQADEQTGIRVATNAPTESDTASESEASAERQDVTRAR